MIRCSSISKIMTAPRTKGAEWSDTSLAYMLEQAREELFGVRRELDDVRAIQKGRACEDAAIELYNRVFLYDLEKLPASARRSDGIITGEADLLAIKSQKGIDLKCSWSLLTFPLTADQAAKKEYEWQARGYMRLYDVPEWEIAYCMIDTPDEFLRDWDDIRHHRCDPSMPLHHRITVAKYQRDEKLEAAMLEKCAAANEWIAEAVQRFAAEHDEYIS